MPGGALPPVCSRPSTHSMQDGYRGVEFEEDRHGDEVQRGVTGAIGVLSVEPAGETPANEPFPLLSSDMLEEIIRRELDSAAQIINDEEELEAASVQEGAKPDCQWTVVPSTTSSTQRISPKEWGRPAPWVMNTTLVQRTPRSNGTERHSPTADTPEAPSG